MSECDECKEREKERDEALEALNLIDGRAAEVFSEYWESKAQLKYVRQERDALRILVKKSLDLLTRTQDETPNLLAEIQELSFEAASLAESNFVKTASDAQVMVENWLNDTHTESTMPLDVCGFYLPESDVRVGKADSRIYKHPKKLKEE